MTQSRPRAVYRVLRDQLVPALTGRSEPPAVEPRPPFAEPRRREPSSHLALIVGHFTFNNWYATYGDTEAMHVVASWLEEAGIPFDVACHPDNGTRGVDFWTVDPDQYTIVVFVCGPWLDRYKALYFDRFPGAVKVGVNLSVVSTAGEDFDLLFARDRGAVHSPDIVLTADPGDPVPLAGVFLVHEQPEYGERQRHGAITSAVDEYLGRGEVLAVPLDTLHVGNPSSATSARQLDAVLRRLDLVITTRLHGFVFALRAGVPPVAIDPVAGGGKVSAQARAVGWPLLIAAEDLTAESLADAVERGLEGSSRALAGASSDAGRSAVGDVRRSFVAAMAALGAPAAPTDAARTDAV